MTPGVDQVLAPRLVSRRPKWTTLLVPGGFQRTRTHHDACGRVFRDVVRFREGMRSIAAECVSVGRDYESVAQQPYLLVRLQPPNPALRFPLQPDLRHGGQDLPLFMSQAQQMSQQRKR